jgi:threonine aldolase
MNWIDLRSDTVTRPSAAMLEAMMKADVGDDVFGEDPAVNALQEYTAALFGKEAALFCPSGTQTNQIAIGVHTRPGDEVVCSAVAHIYLYEGGGIAQNSGCSVRLIGNERGQFTAAEVAAEINDPHNDHLPRTRLVSVEDTVNKGGGSIWPMDELKKISALCRSRGLLFHCDGARVLNALTETGTDPVEYGSLYDSLSICLSKGLGAPAGSLLIGSREFIALARRRRKSMGGGMRQAGYLAAAGLFALEHHVSRLTHDHEKARTMGSALLKTSYVSEVLPVQTNIVIFKVKPAHAASDVVTALAKEGIRCFTFGADKVRMVFHLDITDELFERALKAITKAGDHF